MPKPTHGIRSQMKKAASLPYEGIFPEELAPLRDILSPSFSFGKSIGQGKNGVAYALSSIANPDWTVCLKTIRTELLADATKREEGRDSLQKEVEILSPLRHRCLPTVFSANTDAKFPLPYYVSTFHPGQKFSDFRNSQTKLSLREAFYVVSSLIDVLKYIHREGRTHCDLHAGNVLISKDVLRDGILVIDFGSGHRQSDTTSGTVNKGNIHFKPPELQRLDRKVVHRSQANDEFQKSDLAALGSLLSQMQDAFLSEASVPIREEYGRFAYDLKQGAITEWNEIDERFELVVDPNRALGKNLDLFLRKNGQPGSITVPVTGAVLVGQAPLSVINSTAFQRLRKIPQLSFCDWHFPGATHTRFEHSLGVFENANSPLKKPRSRPRSQD
ncbi:MAG: protein kinase, partial [Planctomycetaceae bacterium]